MSNNKNKPYYQKLIKELQHHIKNSLSDSLYYEILAQGAPNQRARDTLIDFSKDKTTMAQNFIRLYKKLTGTYYKLPSIEAPILPDYKKALEQMMDMETNRYKEYGLLYIGAWEKEIQDVFLNARTIEAIHAMCLPLVLEDEERD